MDELRLLPEGKKRREVDFDPSLLTEYTAASVVAPVLPPVLFSDADFWRTLTIAGGGGVAALPSLLPPSLPQRAGASSAAPYRSSAVPRASAAASRKRALEPLLADALGDRMLQLQGDAHDADGAGDGDDSADGSGDDDCDDASVMRLRKRRGGVSSDGGDDRGQGLPEAGAIDAVREGGAALNATTAAPPAGGRVVPPVVHQEPSPTAAECQTQASAPPPSMAQLLAENTVLKRAMVVLAKRNKDLDDRVQAQAAEVATLMEVCMCPAGVSLSSRVGVHASAVKPELASCSP